MSKTYRGDNFLDMNGIPLVSSNILTDTNWVTGFLNTYDGTNVPDTTISFNTSSKIFTIAPTGTSYSFYSKGVKFTKTGDTINITGATGAATCTKSIATGKGWTVNG